MTAFFIAAGLLLGELFTPLGKAQALAANMAPTVSTSITAGVAAADCTDDGSCSGINGNGPPG